jgi:hypothetical protein
MLDEGFGQAETEGGLVDEKRLKEISIRNALGKDVEADVYALVAEVRRLREALSNTKANLGNIAAIAKDNHEQIKRLQQIIGRAEATSVYWMSKINETEKEVYRLR